VLCTQTPARPRVAPERGQAAPKHGAARERG
jgi:hypothetical protein